MSREWEVDAYGDPVRPDLDERPTGFDTDARDADGRMIPGPNARRILAKMHREAADARDRDALDRAARWQEWND